MATSAPPQTEKPPVSKYDAYVERQLQHAGKRVRSIDLFGAVLILAAALLAYTIAIVVLDWCFRISLAVRLAGLGIFVTGILGFCAYLAYAVIRRRVNPYYSARQLEKTMPDAKGSLMSWLDLRDESLAPAFRGALSVRAAKDLNKADMEAVASTRRNWWLAGSFGVLLLALIFLFLFRPGQMSSLLGRAFLPFQDIQVASATRIKLVAPTGDSFIGEKEAAEFRIRVSGTIPANDAPDAPKLHFRFNQKDRSDFEPFREVNDFWTVRLAAGRILSGRVYWHVTAGDAKTPEYLLRVQSAPRVLEYNIQYEPRKYTGWREQRVTFPNEHVSAPEIKHLAGTEITLRIKVNRMLRSAELQTKEGDVQLDDIAGKQIGEDSSAREFRFQLTKSGTFRIRFASDTKEQNSDERWHPVIALKDTAPVVALTKPEKEEVKLAANGLLKLEGIAEDDFGIKEMTLRMKHLRGKLTRDLTPKPYRKGKSFLLPNGSYPKSLEYKDFIELAKVEFALEGPAKLAPGDIIEYWLDAVDASDYPNRHGNVGRSDTFKVVITDPEKDGMKIDQQRSQAEKEQQQHQRQQDEKFSKEAEEITNFNNSLDPKKKQNFEKELNKLDEFLKNDKSKQNESAKRNDGVDPEKGSGKGKGKNEDNPGSAKSNDAKPGGNKELSEPKPAPELGKPNGQGKQGTQQQPGPEPDRQGQAKNAGQCNKSGAKNGNQAGGGQQGKNASAKKGAPKDGGGGAKKSGGESGMPQSASAKGERDPGAPKDKRGSEKSDGSSVAQTACAKGGKPGGSGAGQNGGVKSAPPQKSAANAKQQKGVGENDGGPSASKSAGKGSQAIAKGSPGGGKSGGGRGTASGGGNSGAKGGQIAKLVSQFKDASKKRRADIMKELQEFAQDPKDPQVRKEAEDALTQVQDEKIIGRGDPTKKGKLPDGLGGDPGGNQKATDAEGKGLSPGNGAGKNRNGNGGINSGEFEPGQIGSNGIGPATGDEPGNADAANAEFARRIGNLQLENLRDKLRDPEFRRQLRQKMKWSEADLRRWLKLAGAYKKQQKAEALPQLGSFTSKFSGIGPRRVGRLPSKQNPFVDTPKGVPPPEYRRIFERRSTRSVKKK